MGSSTRLESLTFLRFIAASVVILFHFGQKTTIYPLLPDILKLGPVMVTFFFALSGFVLSVSHVGRKISAAIFYKNRLARIAPIYFIALAITCVLTEVKLNSAEFYFTASLLQSWIPPYPLAINAPGWSISVEAFFYAICPALIIVAGSNESVNLKGWIIASIATWLLTQTVLSSLLDPSFHKGFPSYAHDLINYFPISHLCSFMLGFTAGIAYKNGFLRTTLPSHISTTLFLATLLLTTLAIQYRSTIGEVLGVPLAYSASFFSIFFVPCIYFCALSEKTIGKILAAPLLVLLGEASYSMYILQKPLYVAYSEIFLKIGIFGHDRKFIAFFIALTIISIICYLLIEKPATKFIKNLSLRSKVQNLKTLSSHRIS